MDEQWLFLVIYFNYKIKNIKNIKKYIKKEKIKKLFDIII